MTNGGKEPAGLLPNLLLRMTLEEKCKLLEPPALLLRISPPQVEKRRTECKKELSSPWEASDKGILPDSKQL